MNFPSRLIEAKLIKRYKRFLADVISEDGIKRTVYCPNPGSMHGLIEEGNKIWLQRAENKKAKFSFVWKLVEIKDGTLVCIDTQIANKIVFEALSLRRIPGLKNCSEIIAEPKIENGSRLDFLIKFKHDCPCYLEVKSVTLSREAGVVEFPDSVTSRGEKHLRLLMQLKSNGFRAIQLFIIQRTDANYFKIAKDIDQRYYQAFEEAKLAGVEFLFFTSEITTKEIIFGHSKPLFL